MVILKKLSKITSLLKERVGSTHFTNGDFLLCRNITSKIQNFIDTALLSCQFKMKRLLKANERVHVFTRQVTGWYSCGFL